MILPSSDSTATRAVADAPPAGALPADPRFSWTQAIPVIAGLIAAVGAVWSLVRWLIPSVLTAPSSLWSAYVSPASCVALAAAATALLLRSAPARHSGSSLAPGAAAFCSLVPVLVGLLKLRHYVFATADSHFELFGLGAKWQGDGLPEMARLTAFAHVALGLSLWRARRRASSGLSQTLALLVATIATLPLTEHLYGAAVPLLAAEIFVPVAALILILAVGVLFLHPEDGWMRVVTNASTSGQLVRRFLPGLLLPFILGWFRLQAQRVGWVGLESGLAVFALSNVILFAVLIWINARLIERSDDARQQAEAKARARDRERARLAAVVDSSGDAIISKTLEGIITTWNRGAERIFGYTEEEAMGRPLLMLFPPDRRDEEPGILQCVARGVAVEHFDTVRVRKDGRLIHISVAISPVRDETGRIVGASSIARDITQRWEMEAALRKSEDRFQKVLENMSEGIVLSDLEGNLLHWNPAALRMHGYVDAEEWRRNLSDFQNQFELRTVDRRVIPFDQWPIRRILAGERLKDFLVRLRQIQKGWERVVSYSGELIQTADGQRLAFIGISDRTALFDVQHAQALFRTWVDNSNDAFEVIDPATARYVDFNHTACHALGYTREELLALRVFEVDPTLNERTWPEFVERLRRQGTVTHEGIALRKDQESYPVEVTFRWVNLDRPYIVCVVRDITERQLAAFALTESEQRFRQLTESLPQMVWACTSMGECNYLSPQWSSYVGDATGDLGYGWVRRVHEDDRPGLMEAWQAAVAQGVRFDREIRLAGREGHYRWFQMRGVPLRDGQGNVVKWFGTTTDIHELRGLREDLRETQARLQNTLAMGRIGTFSIDFERNRTEYDDSLIKLYGRKWNETDGANLSSLLAYVDYADRESVSQVIESVLHGTGPAQVEFRYRRPDGSELWLASRLAVERDGQGRVSRLLGACVDITERKRVEEVRLQNAELEIENRKIQEANRLKSEFLANMSHELRTPLNGIIGFTEFLIDGRPGPLTPKQAEYLTDVYQSSQHLLQLINDVLDLSKIEAGRMTLYVAKFPVRESVDQVCGVIKSLAERQKVQVAIHIAPELVEISLDEQKFKQILFNLLSNAVKFTDPGGRAELRLEPLPGDRFRLEVRDTGIGIKPEDFARLFREFEQLSTGASRRFEGTGLGLALTRKLVELHGGEISVTSEVGQGTTFFVVLPLHCKITTEMVEFDPSR